MPAASIERVARAHLRESRACWHSAYARRSPHAPEIAKVVVAFQVSRGSVHDVTSTGDPPGYFGLARCVTDNVARWHSPRASTSRFNSLSSINPPSAPTEKVLHLSNYNA